MSFSNIPEELREELEEQQRLQRGLSVAEWEEQLKVLSTLSEKIIQRTTLLRQVLLEEFKKKEQQQQSEEQEYHSANIRNATENNTGGSTKIVTNMPGLSNPASTEVTNLLFLQHPDIMVAESRALALSALDRCEALLTVIRASLPYSRLQYLKQHEAEVLVNYAQLLHLAQLLFESTIDLLEMEEHKKEEEWHEQREKMKPEQPSELREVKIATTKSTSFDFKANMQILRELREKYLYKEIDNYFTAAYSWMCVAKENRLIRFDCAKRTSNKENNNIDNNNDNNECLFDSIIAVMLGCGLLVNCNTNNYNQSATATLSLKSHQNKINESEQEEQQEEEKEENRESVSERENFVIFAHERLIWLSHELEIYFEEFEMAKYYAELAAVILTQNFSQEVYNSLQVEHKNSVHDNEYASNLLHANTTSKREKISKMYEGIFSFMQTTNVIIVPTYYMSRYLSAIQTACELSVKCYEFSRVIVYVEHALSALRYLNTHLPSCSNSSKKIASDDCYRCDKHSNIILTTVTDSNNDNSSNSAIEEQRDAQYKSLECESECRCIGSIISLREKCKECTTPEERNSVYECRYKHKKHICSEHVAFWTSYTSAFVELHVLLIIMLLYTLLKEETRQSELQQIAQRESKHVNANTNTSTIANANCEISKEHDQAVLLTQMKEITDKEITRTTSPLSESEEECEHLHPGQRIYNVKDVLTTVHNCIAKLESCQQITSVIETHFYLETNNDKSNDKVKRNNRQYRPYKLQKWPILFTNSKPSICNSSNQTSCVKFANDANSFSKCENASIKLSKCHLTGKSVLEELNESSRLRNKQYIQRKLRQSPYYLEMAHQMNDEMNNYIVNAKTHPVIAMSMLLYDLTHIVKTIVAFIITTTNLERYSRTCDEQNTTMSKEAEEVKEIEHRLEEIKITSTTDNSFDTNEEVIHGTKKDVRHDKSTENISTLFKKFKILATSLNSFNEPLPTLIASLQKELQHLKQPQPSKEDQE